MDVMDDMDEQEREPVFEDDPYSFTMAAIREALKRGLLNTDHMNDSEASVLGELNATLFKLDPSSAAVFDEGDVEGG
jgi:hypothetical protein